jgi:tetrahydromethanopterin S-methyltransferase subunit F
MTVRTRANSVEIVQLAILLIVVAVFYNFIIPYSIIDPEGFGLDQGLPPSFSSKLVSGIAVIIMLFRLGNLIITPSIGSEKIIIENDYGLSSGLPMRGLMGMAAAVVFSQLLIPVLGFYIASVLLLIGMLKILGEKSIIKLVFIPLLVVAGVWLLFAQLLSIRLPSSFLS